MRNNSVALVKANHRNGTVTENHQFHFFPTFIENCDNSI
jgi:hypothetical protein